MQQNGHDLPLPSELMSVRTNVLGTHDIGTLREMLALFGDAFAERERYTAKQPDDHYLRGLLANETFIAIAACSGACVAGGLAGYVLPKFENLQTLAVQRGIYVIFVQAEHGDDPAIALYEKLGQREDVLHFDIAPSTGAA